MATNPLNTEYQHEDFSSVPEDLRHSWQRIVEYDVEQSRYPIGTYLEWRVFTRVVFAPWKDRTEVLSGITADSGHSLPASLVEEAIDHCARALSTHRVRDKLVPHLMRHKPGLPPTPEGEKKQFFCNDVERALYLLYEREAENYASNALLNYHLPGGDQERLRDKALEELRRRIKEKYSQEYEDYWAGLTRTRVKQAIYHCVRDVRKGRNRSRNAPPLAFHSLNAPTGPEQDGKLLDFISDPDAKDIRGVDLRDEVSDLLAAIDRIQTESRQGGKKRGYFSDVEYTVLNTFINNTLADEPRTKAALAEEMNMQANVFGATLTNALNKMRRHATLSVKLGITDDDSPARG